MTAGPERNGVLVIRAWVETDTGRLRARITRSTGLGGARLVTTAATADEVLGAVQDWLERLLTD